MAKTIKVKASLSDAASVRTVWESNPGFMIGTIGLNDFIAAYDAAEALDKGYAKKDVELTGVRSKRDDKARELFSLVTRFRSAVRGHFGPDSTEYGQAGGTRSSARRSPVRKPAVASADTAVVTKLGTVQASRPGKYVMRKGRPRSKWGPPLVYFMVVALKG